MSERKTVVVRLMTSQCVAPMCSGTSHTIPGVYTAPVNQSVTSASPLHPLHCILTSGITGHIARQPTADSRQLTTLLHFIGQWGEQPGGSVGVTPDREPGNP